ncbi:hypothetical protein LF1_29610 [Rubripirellula obstinata]|uniref:Uncharacterized protein n=1 Tax=Rubripirellula obstinata TaxID=406547 RepID=A0A5B1CJF9_9BACT|nr:hypothetical protein [Rubripirellula obstinata]KAA1260421.1 hypothetical protein LF1_29610 [Rubripirellula obstinata]
MAVKIKPNPDQLNQLLRCAKIDGEKLADLVIHLGGLSEPPLVADRLLDELKKQLTEDEAELLLSQVLSLSMLVRVSESKSVDVMKALRVAIDSPDQQSEWDSIAVSMQGLIDSTPIRLLTKAMELSYDYANLLRKARIITDLRPLFDDEGEKVEGGVVTHTLRVAYSSDDGGHEVSLALDLQDVKKLREQCDRAIVKANSIRDEFIQSTKKPCLISGESEERNE